MTGVLMQCNQDICTLEIGTEAGNFSVGPLPVMQALQMLASMYANGVELSEGPVQKQDPYLLPNLKAELAAAKNNLRLKQEIAGTGYVEGEGYGQSQYEHLAGIESIFLDMEIERLTKEIKEIEDNDN